MNATLQTIVDLIWQQYTAVKAGIINDIFTSLSQQVRLVAGIGALVYIFSSMIGQIARGETIDFFPYLRPFLLVGMIALAPSLCDIMDKMGRDLYDASEQGNMDLSRRIEKQEDLMRQAVQTKHTKKANNPAVSITPAVVTGFGSFAGTAPLLQDNGNSFSDGFEELGSKIKAWLLSLIQDILLILMQIAEAALILISIGYRLILRVAAPIVFVAAIFPGMSGGMAEWFSKYINYTLMPFVATIVGKVAFKFTLEYLTQYTNSLNGSFTPGIGADAVDPTLMGIAFIGMLACCLVLFAQVPSLTQMFVTAGGVGAMVSGATGMLSRGADAAGSVVKPVVKGGAALTAMTTVGVAGYALGGIGGAVDYFKGYREDKTKNPGGVGSGGAAGSPGTAGRSASISVTNQIPLSGGKRVSLGTKLPGTASGEMIDGAESKRPSLLASMSAGAGGGFKAGFFGTRDFMVKRSRDMDALKNFSYAKTTAERQQSKLREARNEVAMTGNVAGSETGSSEMGKTDGDKGGSPGGASPDGSATAPVDAPDSPSPAGSPSAAGGIVPVATVPVTTPDAPAASTSAKTASGGSVSGRTQAGNVGKRVMGKNKSHSVRGVRDMLTASGSYRSSYNQPLDASGNPLPTATTEQVQQSIQPVEPTHFGEAPSQTDWTAPDPVSDDTVSETGQIEQTPVAIPTKPTRSIGGFFRAVARGGAEGFVSGAGQTRDSLIMASRFRSGISNFSYLPTTKEIQQRRIQEEQTRKALLRQQDADSDETSFNFTFNNQHRHNG